jgi:D-glycero-D-manno-heptose 1,7-bisphosphate phosphatase
MAKRFAMLDRDGTIIREKHYLSRPEDVELLPGAATGLQMLSGLGMGLVVLTNQSGIGRGYFDEDSLRLVHDRMSLLLACAGVEIDAIYHCPHVPEDRCNCRKPNTGLVTRAASELGFIPCEGIVVGDKSIDVELGRSVGATSFLVLTGYGEQERARGAAHADYVVADLEEVARIVLDIRTQGI